MQVLAQPEQEVRHSSEVEFRVTDVDAAHLLEESPQSPETRRQLVKQLLEFVHHSLENENPHAKGISGFIGNWVSKANFRRIGINAHRSYHMSGKQGPLAHLVPDVITMLLTSHTIEMTSSLWGTALGSHFGLSPQALLGIAATGGVISVPGLDPLCIGLMIVYGASERMRKAVGVGRVVLFKTTNVLARYSGVQHVVDRLFWSEDRLTYFLHYSSHQNQHQAGRFFLARVAGNGIDFGSPVTSGAVERDSFVFMDRESSRSALRFDIVRTGEDVYLEAIQIDPSCRDCLLEIYRSKVLKSLGWNARDALKSTIYQRVVKNQPLDSQPHFYVQSATENSVRFHDGAIHMAPVRHSQVCHAARTALSQLGFLNR